MILRRIRDTVRKAKKSLESLDGDWWHSDACFEMFASSQDYIPTKSVRQKKDLKDLSLQQQRTRISNDLVSIKSLSVIKDKSEIKIAALALQLLYNEGDNRGLQRCPNQLYMTDFLVNWGIHPITRS